MDIRDCKHFIINGSSAAAADGFCGIEWEDGTKARELHQNKHIKSTVCAELFEREMEKAALEKDFFILYTTHSSDVTPADLKFRSGLVCKENFDNYFGPFSSRAFRVYKPSINSATRSQLTAIPGIGAATADKILTERKRGGNFKDREDAIKRIRLNRTYSNYLSYP